MGERIQLTDICHPKKPLVDMFCTPEYKTLLSRYMFLFKMLY